MWIHSLPAHGGRPEALSTVGPPFGLSLHHGWRVTASNNEPCEAWQGTPDDYILRSRCKVHDIALTECHAKAEIARLRAENLNCMEARRKALARSEEVIMELRADLYKQTSCHQRDLEEATRLRLAIEELKKDVVHAADERDKLRAEVEELRKGLSRTQGELNEILAERNTIAKERDEARAALRNFVREHLEEIHAHRAGRSSGGRPPPSRLDPKRSTVSP